MTDGPREQFKDALQTALGTMQGVRYWGGSYPRPLTIERGWHLLYEVAARPYLCFFDDEDSLMGDPQRDSQDTYFDRARFMILGAVQGDANATCDVWMGRMNRDCKLTLRRGVAKGGSLRSLTKGVEFLDEAVEFKENNQAYFALPFMTSLEDPL